MAADYNFLDLEDNLHNFKEGFDYLIEESSQGAVVLAGFLSFYLLIKIGMKLLAGERFPWLDIFKPLLIFVFVASWSGVVNLMDDIGFFVEDNIVTSVQETGKAARKSIGDNIKHDWHNNMAGEPEEPGGEPQEKTGFGKFATGVGLGIKTAVNFALNELNAVSSAGITLFLKLLCVLARIVLQIMGYVYLVLLGILGSWALAFGIIPELNTIRTWFASYLQYFLWGPLCCLVNRISTGGLVMNISNVLSSDIVNPFFSKLFDCGFDLAIIFVLFSIPKISRILISSGEDIAGSALGQFAAKTAGDVMKAAGTIVKGGV